MAAVTLLLFRVRAVLTPFFLALVITYALNPAVAFLSRKGLARVWAILVLYAAFGLLLGWAIVYVVPLLVEELNRFGETIPEYTARVQGIARSLREDYSRVRLPDSLRQAIDQNIASMEQRLISLIRGSVQAIVGAFSGLLSMILAPVLAFYILKDLDYLKQSAEAMIPVQHRAAVLEILRQVDRVLGGFIRGQLIVAAIVGILVTIAMLLLGMRFALLLGIIAGVAEVIPYFGPIIGAIPAVILALLRSPFLALKVAVAFAAIQQLENTVIAPKIVGDRVGLHPVIVIFALLVGGHLMGVTGILLAVPIAGVLKVIAGFIWRKLL